MMPSVTLYMRPGCHLCEDASALLRQLGCEAVEVNIDEDADLLLRYNERVPVLAIGGEDLLEGIITAGDARAALRGWSPPAR